MAMMGCWFSSGFCSGLPGEEMLLLELKGAYKSLDQLIHPRNGCPPHYTLYLAGVTKGNRISGAKFGVPIVETTEGSGLEPGLWVYMRS